MIPNHQCHNSSGDKLLASKHFTTFNAHHTQLKHPDQKIKLLRGKYVFNMYFLRDGGNYVFRILIGSSLDSQWRQCVQNNPESTVPTSERWRFCSYW